MKNLVFTIACVLMMLVAGCTKVSHSGNLTATGKIFKIGGEGYNIMYVNGLLSMNIVRENAESIVETNDVDAFGNPVTDAKTVKSIRFRTGPIISGYLVDMSKVDPGAATAYVSQMYKLNKAAWDAKQPAVSESSKKNDAASSGSSAKETSSSTTDKIKEVVDKVKDSDAVQSIIDKVTGEKDEGKNVINGDGEYKELYKDNTIAYQRALANELIKYADDTTKFEATGETFKLTLTHFLERLEKVEKFGGVNTAMRIKYATIKDGKLTGLMYVVFNEDGTSFDENCPSCVAIENAKYDNDGNPIYVDSQKKTP